MSLTEQLKAAIFASGKSFYRITKDTGVAGAILIRFANEERGMRLETADKLAAYLGMELTPTRPGPTKPAPIKTKAAPTRKNKAGRK